MPLLGALVLLHAAPAQAQTVTLVSNAGQSGSGGGVTGSVVMAQGFTTGSASNGYTLSSIEIRLPSFFTTLSSSDRATVRAQLWSAAGGGGPGSKAADLRVPSTVGAGTVSFGAPSNTRLTAGTTYFLVLYTVGTLELSPVATTSGNEDSGGQAGWSMADQVWVVLTDEPGANPNWVQRSDVDYALKIAVKGSEAPAPVAPAPVQGSALWSGTLTVRDYYPDVPGTFFGCDDGTGSGSTPATAFCEPTGALTDDDFSWGGATYSVKTIGFGNGIVSITFDKALPYSLVNSLSLTVAGYALPLVIGSYDTRSDGQRIRNFHNPTWSPAKGFTISIPGWTEGATFPMSLVWRAPEAPSSLHWSLTGRANGLHVGWGPAAGAAAYDLHYTSSTSVADGAAASGSDPAAGWVDAGYTAAAGEDTSQHVIEGLVDGREYRVRLRGKNDGRGAGPWLHDKEAAGQQTIVRTPDATCLTGLEIKGVKPDGTKTDEFPLLGRAAHHVGLGGPGFYVIRVPTDVKKVEVTPTWTTSGFTAMGANTRGLTGGPDTIWHMPGAWSTSGTARELLLAPGNAVTRIVLELGATGCAGVAGLGLHNYEIYAYHDLFAKSANDRLRSLQLTVGN